MKKSVFLRWVLVLLGIVVVLSLVLWLRNMLPKSAGEIPVVWKSMDWDNGVIDVSWLKVSRAWDILIVPMVLGLLWVCRPLLQSTHTRDSVTVVGTALLAIVVVLIAGPLAGCGMILMWLLVFGMTTGVTTQDDPDDIMEQMLISLLYTCLVSALIVGFKYGMVVGVVTALAMAVFTVAIPVAFVLMVMGVVGGFAVVVGVLAFIFSRSARKETFDVIGDAWFWIKERVVKTHRLLVV